jgi:Hg(II)-responsive transcriptional regulator
MMKTLTIGKAAARVGVNVETIRFYERRGLIAQPKKPRSGFREYGADVVARIRFIRQAQEIGFSLREIRELLSLRADPKADCSHVQLRAIIKRDEVDRKIDQLQQIRAALDELVSTCPGGGALCACTILEAMERADAQVQGTGPRRKGEDPAPARRATKRNTAMKTLTFAINGMHCEGCARTIAAVVSAEPGVRKASVSFKTGEADILFEPALVGEGRLAAAIREAGYKVTGRSSSGER